MPFLLSVLSFAFSVLAVILLIIFLSRNSNKKIEKLEFLFSSFENKQDRLESLLRDENHKNRAEQSLSLKTSADSLIKSISEISGLQKSQLEMFGGQISALTLSNEQKMENLRHAVEERLKAIQDDNGKKLEQMRATVDEKLSATLETRLGESFKLVSERLEQVHKGLGEMQTLASGVGDLKKVLTNVKTRGTWGEIQLGSLLEQIFTPDQYEKNVAVKKKSAERVEFAIKMPGNNGRKDAGDVVWLPIDSKFPQEDYQRLVDAAESGNAEAADEAIKQLEIRLKSEAKSIRDKYISPPDTTDFAIMFLPTEGLYSEALRRAGLCDHLQREFRVVVTGPTTLAALLNCLQMGFRTLAVEKRSSEVWALLGTVKAEFGKFGDILEKTQKKLQEASNTIDDATKKTRTIVRKLKDVQSTNTPEAVTLLEADDE
jgi:DNA recombination protein RmuC